MARFLNRALAFGAMICVGQVPVHADILLNASFELPPIGNAIFSDFDPDETIGNGWVVDPQSATVLLWKSGALGGPTTTDGDQFLFLGAAPVLGIVWQDVALSASTEYRLAFQLADQPDDALGAAARIDVLLGGSTIIGGPALFEVVQGSGFQSKELFFTTTQSAIYRLKVIADGGSTSVDAFSLVAVPEPSSIGLVAMMLLGVSISQRRSNRRS